MEMLLCCVSWTYKGSLVGRQQEALFARSSQEFGAFLLLWNAAFTGPPLTRADFGCFLPVGEALLHGPVFVREPSDGIVPVGSEEKQVTLTCEARGNPSPHYRYSGKFEN